MNQHPDREYHERRAEEHLELASRASEQIVRDRHLNMASRHATLASLVGDLQRSAEATRSVMETDTD